MLRTFDWPDSRSWSVRNGTPISSAKAACVSATELRRLLILFKVIEDAPDCCYISGNRRGCSPSGPQLPADGDRYSPLAEPDLKGELDAHGGLQSSRSGIASVRPLCT